MSNQNSTDIAESMAQLLAPAYIEKKASSNGTAEAMVSLLKAAEIFENLDMVVAAEAVTSVLERVAEPVDWDLGNYVSTAIKNELHGPITDFNQKLGGDYLSVDVTSNSGTEGLSIRVMFSAQNAADVYTYVQDQIAKLRHYVDTNVAPKYINKYKGKIGKIYSLG